MCVTTAAAVATAATAAARRLLLEVADGTVLTLDVEPYFLQHNRDSADHQRCEKGQKVQYYLSTSEPGSDGYFLRALPNLHDLILPEPIPLPKWQAINNLRFPNKQPILRPGDSGPNVAKCSNH